MDARLYFCLMWNDWARYVPRKRPPARRSAENVNDLFADGQYNRKHSRVNRARNRLDLLPPCPRIEGSC
jgi:hypothetical protein